MRVTIIPEDQTVIVDGEALQFPLSADANIHAIQWYGDHGVIEYKVGEAKRFVDSAVIQPWTDAWNTTKAASAAEASAPPTAPPTAAQTKATLIASVQSHLDAAARGRGYDDIKSATTYADEPSIPRFQVEGRAFRAWRSLVWDHCYGVMGDVETGVRVIPTPAQLIAELPAVELP